MDAEELLDANLARIVHFRQRVDALGRTGSNTLIMVISGNAPMGGLIADILMPSATWRQDVVGLGPDGSPLHPVARGLAEREGMMPALLEGKWSTAYRELLENPDDLFVLVIDEDDAIGLIKYDDLFPPVRAES